MGGVDLTEQLEIWDADTDSEESEQEMPEEVVWEQVHRDDRLQLPNSGDFSNSLGPDSTGDGQRGEKSGETNHANAKNKPVTRTPPIDYY